MIWKRRYYRNGDLYDATEYILNDYGEPLQEIVAYGTEDQATTTYAYNDDIGKVETKTNAENETTTYGYDSRGNLTSVKNGENETTGYVYDLMNRKVGMANDLSETMSWSYDANGNKTKERDPLGREILYG